MSKGKEGNLQWQVFSVVPSRESGNGGNELTGIELPEVPSNREEY